MAARLSLSNADVRHTATKTMSFDMFLDILFIRNLKEYIAPDKQELVAEAVRSLLTPHWHEVISEATRDALDVDFLSEWSRFDVYMNILILVVVFINLLAAGISLDYSPGHWGWFALEIGCLLVFVAEVVTKLRTDGVRKYFLGRQRRLHMLDVGVMILSFIEVCISIYVLHVPARQDLPTGVWLAALGRILKVACVVRLMKFVQSPALTDLVNMLLGFMIGFPVLLWVMVLFCATLLILGFLGRLFLGPAPGQDMVATCGNPDTILDQGDATCKVHHMYGEVYFGSLATSCFTAFRFMLGDFATRGGRSMLVAFSNGYGNVFNIAFIVYMVSVIFGLFNIITAIFVDRTTSGLKRESEQRKYIRQYGRAYVQDRLRELVTRVSELWRKFPRSSMHGRRLMSAKREGSARSQSGRVSIVDFSLDEEEFRAVMKDARVHELMTELDVATANPASFFNAFSPDNGGAVTLRGMVEGILRLRGEPHKSDVIASAMSIQALHDKFDRFALMQSPNGVNMS
uniref:Ion transport domain-containing protein n=1 Tax=Zooxanthella nutricula TaxID=1333877 RepID=A0A7S2VSC1_9DINO